MSAARFDRRDLLKAAGGVTAGVAATSFLEGTAGADAALPTARTSSTSAPAPR